MEKLKLPIRILDRINSVETIVEVGSGYKTLDSIFQEAYYVIKYLVKKLPGKKKKEKKKKVVVELFDIDKLQLEFPFLKDIPCVILPSNSNRGK